MEEGRESEKQKGERENEMTFISKLLFYEIKVNNTKQQASVEGENYFLLLLTSGWMVWARSWRIAGEREKRESNLGDKKVH